jgi:hypothetical protein
MMKLLPMFSSTGEELIGLGIIGKFIVVVEDVMMEELPQGAALFM